MARQFVYFMQGLSKTYPGNRKAAVCHPFTTERTGGTTAGRTGTIETLF